MLKIKELKVNSVVTIPLVVLSATSRLTKSKKPYLHLEFFDGTETIAANYWDWTSGSIPDVNAILDVTGQVTEYMGAKQLNVHKLVTNTELHLSMFKPDNGVDIAAVYKEAYALASRIEHPILHDIVIETYEEFMTELLEAPAAKGVHHAWVGGLLVHSLAVAKHAFAMSKNIPESNDDLCIAGGLLHDIGKLQTYRLNGIAIDMTEEGMLHDHVYIGAAYLESFITKNNREDTNDTINLLKHIVLSHHGQLEFGSPVTPMCIEAYLVNSADVVDSSIQQILECSRNLDENTKWTDRIRTLNNKPHMTPSYVKQLLLGSSLPF